VEYSILYWIATSEERVVASEKFFAQVRVMKENLINKSENKLTENLWAKSGMIGVYKIETQVTSSSGKFDRTGLGSDYEAKEVIDSAYKYLKANSKNVNGNIGRQR